MFDVTFLIPDEADDLDEPPCPDETISDREIERLMAELFARYDSGAFDLDNEINEP